MMPQIKWDTLIKQGIFAALFVWLLYNNMQTNEAREKRYLDTIDQLSKQNAVKLDELKAMHTR